MFFLVGTKDKGWKEWTLPFENVEKRCLHVEKLPCFFFLLRLIQTGRRRWVTLAGKLWTSPVSMLESSSPTASASSGGN